MGQIPALYTRKSARNRSFEFVKFSHKRVRPESELSSALEETIVFSYTRGVTYLLRDSDAAPLNLAAWLQVTRIFQYNWSRAQSDKQALSMS